MMEKFFQLHSRWFVAFITPDRGGLAFYRQSTVKKVQSTRKCIEDNVVVVVVVVVLYCGRIDGFCCYSTKEAIYITPAPALSTSF